MRHDPATLLLYCPVPQTTLDAVAATAWRALPLHSAEQLCFYHAPADARAATGYLLRFAIDADYVAEFSTAADVPSPDYFVVPAEEMVEFNYHIVGQLEVVGLLGSF